MPELIKEPPRLKFRYKLCNERDGFLHIVVCGLNGAQDHFLSCFEPPMQFGVVNWVAEGLDSWREAHFLGVIVLMASA